MKRYGLDHFSNERNRAFIRSKSQAAYRKEAWTLTFEQYCGFWTTEELWRQRGRHPEDLVLTRRFQDLPWDTANCCIISRIDHLKAKSNRRWNKDDSIFYTEAILYDENV